MDTRRRNANLVLLLAAAIWGFAFVAQRVGMRHMGPLAFNGIRFGLGALALTPLLILELRRRPRAPRSDCAGDRGVCLRAGLLTGLLIFGGSTRRVWSVREWVV